MEQEYNQWKGAWAVCLAALRSIFRSPQAVFFSLFFPMVLIAIFGAISGGGGPSFDIAIDKKSDTTNLLYNIVSSSRIFDVHKGKDEQIQDDLRKGRITAIITIRKDSSKEVEYIIDSK